MPLPIWLRVKPAPTLRERSKTPLQLRFDGAYWHLDEVAYELTSFSRRPWWSLELKAAISGERRRLSFSKGRLSEGDHRQLCLLHRLIHPKRLGL